MLRSAPTLFLYQTQLHRSYGKRYERYALSPSLKFDLHPMNCSYIHVAFYELSKVKFISTVIELQIAKIHNP